MIYHNMAYNSVLMLVCSFGAKASVVVEVVIEAVDVVVLLTVIVVEERRTDNSINKSHLTQLTQQSMLATSAV
jgi:hypothetical protein